MEFNNNTCYLNTSNMVLPQYMNDLGEAKIMYIPNDSIYHFTTINKKEYNDFNEENNIKKNQVSKKIMYKMNNKILNAILDYNISQKRSSYVHSETCRVPFTHEEDEKLKELTEKYGTYNWIIISSFMNGRTSKQCRDRYCNYLKPEFFGGQWSNEEDDLLAKLYAKHGPKWAIIKKSFPYRSQNSLKNRWNFFLCRHNSDNLANADEN